jgi:hypothetical protein
MPAALQPDSAPESIAEHFYAGALGRIRRFMAAIAPLLILVALWKFGWRSAAGFTFGCAIAYVNFSWLKRVVSGFVEQATGEHPSKSGGIVSRFVLRYVLMAIGAYVILTVSPASLNGLLAGLFLPVGAIACEAGYEVYGAVMRGF